MVSALPLFCMQHTAADFSVLQIRNTVKRNRLTATFDEVRAALSREASIG